MPSVVHVIVTDNFAGAERYVASVARASARLGWSVSMVGGREKPVRAEAGDGVRWLPGGSLRQAIRSLGEAGSLDVCHVHMTYAEAVGVLTRRHRAPVVATRHFAARRGASALGRLLSGQIERRLAGEIAISDFVASRLERPPARVLRTGVEPRPALWRVSNRTVLVLQRLQAEKDTQTALNAWGVSGLADLGWRLRIVGEGTSRPVLERAAAAAGLRSVEFAGFVPEVGPELAAAGMVLATAPAEPLGLSVLEAMAAGVPVVAAGAGGHLETAGRLTAPPLFTPGDGDGAASQLRRLAGDDAERRRLSVAGQALQREFFSLAGHVTELLRFYADVIATRAQLHGAEAGEPTR